MVIVNGETITVEQVVWRVRPEAERLAAKLSARAYLRQLRSLVQSEILRQIDELIVYQRAMREASESDRETFDRAAERAVHDRLQRDFDGSRTRFEAWLARQGLTRDELLAAEKRRIVVREFLRKVILARVHVSRQERLAYYRQNQRKYRSPRRVEMFLIDIPISSCLTVPLQQADQQQRSACCHAADRCCWSAC